MGVLIEHYSGAMPRWRRLEAVGIPIGDAHLQYLTDVANLLAHRGIRVEVDDGDDRLQNKIRNAQKQKIP